MNVFEIFNSKPATKSRAKSSRPVVENIGPDKNDPWEKGWRAGFRHNEFNPYPAGSKEAKQWDDGYAEAEAQPNHYDEGVSEVTGDIKFDKMLKNITGKKEVAKQQKTDTKQQAHDAFGGMFSGGNPADKLTIKKKDVAEAERNELDTPAVQDALKNMAARHNKEQWSKEQLAALGRRLAAQDKKSVKEDATELNVGDDVVISGDVEFNGATGMIVAFGRDKSFVVVNLYNHGKHSFHSSDVSANEYADSDAEEADMYDRDPDARNWASRQGGMEEDQWHGDNNAWSDGKGQWSDGRGQWSDGRGQWSESIDRDVTEYLSEMKSAGYDIK